MNIKIGEKIKQLRKKSDVTQEKLAEYLGVTCQAVSRWENETGYPDIEMLPAIANFFGATTDELLCIDASKDNDKITKILDITYKLQDKGDYKAIIKLIREALKTYPNSFMLLHAYACGLSAKSFSNKTADDTKDLQESVKVLLRILEDCVDDELRYQVKESLVTVYNCLKENDKAISVAKTFPSLSYTRNRILLYAYKGKDFIRQAQENIIDYADALFWHILFVADLQQEHGNELSLQEKIVLLEKSNSILDLVYDGDYLFYHTRIAENYKQLANLYLLLNEYQKANECLTLMCNHIIKFDILTQKEKFSSLLINKIEFDKSIYHISTNHNESFLAIEKLNHEKYDPIRNTNEFKLVLEKLQKHSK